MDNARPHDARVVQDYLGKEGIDRLDLPSKSLDLNTNYLECVTDSNFSPYSLADEYLRA